MLLREVGEAPASAVAAGAAFGPAGDQRSEEALSRGRLRRGVARRIGTAGQRAAVSDASSTSGTSSLRRTRQGRPPTMKQKKVKAIVQP
jgi:hypothetical protein